jgi:uncharacterized protein YgiM (DUF1202 family)
MIFKLIAVALNVFGWFTMYGVVNQFIYSRTRSHAAVEPVVKPKAARVTAATVTADALNMREQPSREGALIRTLKKGDRLTVSGEVQDGWVPVEIDGTRGFVSDSYVVIEEE